MMSRGVFAGAAMPNQTLTSKPGTPLSLSVGTFGNSAMRSREPTASGFILPASTYCMTTLGVAQISGICPPSRSFSAGAVPL